MDNNSICAAEPTFSFKTDTVSSCNTHAAFPPGGNFYGSVKAAPICVEEHVIQQPEKMPNKAKTVLHTNNSNDLLCVKIADDNGNVARDTLIMRDISDVSVIENNGEKKVVIVYFTDGTKEKAVLCDDDTFTLEQGISVCIAKKLLSNKLGSKYGSSIYNKIIDRAVKIYNKSQKEAQKKESEEAAKKEKYRKLIAKKQAKRVKRMEEERERQIEIQKEAYLRAMRECNTRSAD